MMIEEFVDFRVRAGEAVREERQREQARRVDERGRWLRAARRGRRSTGVAGGAVVPGAVGPDAVRPDAVAGDAVAGDAVAPVAAPAAEARNEERRELADVAR